MITRIWHGRTRPENADRYLAFLQQEGTREYLETEGNLSAKVWREIQGDCCHFWTVTEWDNFDSIRSFAGEAYQRAKYYPQDNGMLLEFEEHVNHYETVDVSTGKCRDYMRQLEQLYRGGSWQGETFMDKLKDVDDRTAFTAPVQGVHSIAEIVWHCIYWRTVSIKRLQGDYRYRDETVERLNFLPVGELKKKGWEALKQALAETQTTLLNLLQSHNDEYLKNEYQSGFTYGYQVEGVIQHDIYHLGQIGFAKKILSVS